MSMWRMGRCIGLRRGRGRGCECASFRAVIRVCRGRRVRGGEGDGRGESVEMRELC